MQDAVDSLQVCLRVQRASFTLDVDLALPGRGVSALFGPSGSGKTTILRAMAGLERIANGVVLVNGETWQDESRGLFVAPHRRALGYVPQEANLFPHLSVQGNLQYGLRRSMSRHAGGPAELSEVAEMLGIEHLLGRSSGNLSGGERQRVAIARALLARPRVLLLDEPLASLDFQRKGEILPYLERLHRDLEIPVVFVSHALDEVVRLADHLVLLSSGRVVAADALNEMLARIDLPEMHAQDAGVVLEGRVVDCDGSYGLLTLEVAGGRLLVPHEALPPGRTLRVQVQARDVSVALERPRETSVLNLFPATVVRETAPGGAAHVQLLLDAGGSPLVARITRLSRDRLKLTAGTRVWAQIKAVAVVS